MPLPASRHSRGYILLAVMLLLAALVLLVAIGLQRAGDEGATANLERSDAQARALAEAGLERTRAYLAALWQQDGDLDRALDAYLDTDCTTLPRLEFFIEDDHLPVFADGKPVGVSSSGKTFLRVPQDDNADGAYFVRIDDNDDDAQGFSLLNPTTNNSSLARNCLEGPSLGLLRDDPVRDRDGAVWVTVIGVHPGTSLEGNAARVTLRVLVGPGDPAGIIAGGTVRMREGSHVCGRFGDVVTTGSVEGGCLCGKSCSAGPPESECEQDEPCVAQGGGPRCTAISGRPSGGEMCAANMPVPRPPRVSAWDVTNAPLGCGAPPCSPFYYLRMDTQVSPPAARVYGWNYRACSSPRSSPRICNPSDCAKCWRLFDATPSKKPLEIHLSDQDPGLLQTTPGMSLRSDESPRVWLADGASGSNVGIPGCDADDSTLYPGTPGLGRRDVPNVTFEYSPSDASARLPPGTWFVEGNVRFRKAVTPDCEALKKDPAYSTSIIATGSIIQEEGTLSFRPASTKNFVLFAGRDLVMRGGSSHITTCNSSAVVMVHEQAALGGDSNLQGQLVVENGSSCSAVVTGEAVQMTGNATVSVPALPPVSVGPPLSVRFFSESTH
jgi:hypothetical protein